MDWNSREVRIFINESYMGSSGFYHSEVLYYHNNIIGNWSQSIIDL